MAFDLARTIREATALTRNGKLREATDAIQMALTNGRKRGADANEGEGDEADRAVVQQIAGPTPASPPPSAPLTPTGKSGRPKMPLGSVVEMLRRANRQTSPSASYLLRQPVSLKIPEGAEFSTHTYAGPAGRRNYKLYLPRNRRVGDLPLIVMLHGCKQDPDDFAVGTRMNALAEENGFLVAYPQQPADANPSSCWNWFDPNHQRRGAGEPAIIAGLTNEIADQFGVDRRRIFVAGLSAGAAMATIMGITYPDLYFGIGIHSGLPYGSATDVVSAFAAMRGDNHFVSAGSQASAPNMNAIVFHGDADKTVHPSNSERIVRCFVGSVKGETRSGLSGGRSYIQTTVQNGTNASLEYWLVAGGGHAWSGGSKDGSFADAAGPNASREMVRFFLEAAPRKPTI